MTDSAADYREVQGAFARYLKDPDAHEPPPGLDPERVKVYRDAVFLVARGLVSDNFPAIAKLYDEAAWDALVRDYVREHRATNANFIRVPAEFARYLERRAEEGRGDAPFLPELADFECLETRIGGDLRRHETAGIDPEGELLDGVPVVNSILEVAIYDWPVHRITPEYVPEGPPAQKTVIAAFRTTANRYRFLDVNPVTALLLEALKEADQATGRETLRSLAEQHGLNVDATLAHGEEILERMRSVGVLLGSRITQT